MPQLTDEQIAQHAEHAGFTGQDLETAVAVALAESGGDSDALGDVAIQTQVYGPSVGLWQIRSVNEGHGGWFDRAHRDAAANVDPATNAANAYAIQQRYGWGPWSTHADGSYREFLDRARQAVQSLNNAATPTPTTPAPATPTTPTTPATPARQNSSNPNGMRIDLAQVIQAALRLLQPAKQVSNAAKAVQANKGAFGGTAGAAEAAKRNAETARRCAEQADRNAKELDDLRRMMDRTGKAHEDADVVRKNQLNLLVDPTTNRSTVA